MFLTAPLYSPNASTNVDIRSMMSQLRPDQKYNTMLPSLNNTPNSDDSMKSLLNKFAFHNPTYFIQPHMTLPQSQSQSQLQCSITPASSSVSSAVNTPRMECVRMEPTPVSTALPSPSISPKLQDVPPTIKLEERPLTAPMIVVDEVKDQKVTKPRTKRRSNSASASTTRKAPIKVVFDAANTTHINVDSSFQNGLVTPATSPRPRRKNSSSLSSSPMTGCFHIQKPNNKKVLLRQITKPNNKVYSDRSSVIKLRDNSQKIEQRRKHICQVCLTGFTTSGHLSRHLKIHTGEKSHVCPHEGCNQSFSRHDNCLQHYRTHQKKKD
ncbi:Transcriptional regulator NRG1 [Nakaseomyces bracarensis]|uniref:Transcriptional regulator NRG1 n=1 Tax=Nakaseomyces bracarensis TaxID=273131 RepID=A0ABR4NPN5_9SACH